MAKGKNFFYRVNPHEVLGEAIFQENKEKWFLQFFHDLKNDDPETAVIPLAREMILEAHEFRGKRAIAGKASAEQRANKKQHMLTDVEHMLTGVATQGQQTSTSSSSSSSSSSRTVAETIKEDKNTLSSKPDPIPYQLILDCMNETLGKRFHLTDDFKKLVKARWKEGFRESHFQKVCETMKAKWGRDPKMQNFLRPKTLFNSENFDGYLNAEVTLSDRGIVSATIQKNLSVFEEFAAEIRAEREAAASAE